MPDSLYVKKLKELGFELFDSPMRIEETPANTTHVSGQNSEPMSSRDLLASITVPDYPWFMYLNGRTIVVTENEGFWFLRSWINLEPHGFNAMKVNAKGFKI